AFTVLWVFVGVMFFGSWCYGRVMRGSLLLDCGPHPAWGLFLLYAVGMPVLWFMSELEHVDNVISIGTPYVMSSAILFLVLATGRLEIRENGIWEYWSLLRWEKVKSYRWKDDRTLSLKAKGPL